MKGLRFYLILTCFGLAGVVGAGPSAAADIPAHIQAAVDNPARSDAARGRDEGRKPAEILAFFGIEPGMTVLDYGAGGGYYTELLSYAVGANGKVIAKNNPGQFYETRIKPNFEPLVARLGNVEPLVVPNPEMKIADNSLDAVFIFLMFHHMHFNAAQGDVLPAGSKATLATMRKALKPGGVLAIIEHASLDGASRADSAALHRIDDATTIADITGEGFVLDATSDVLHSDVDDRSVYWRGATPSGKTWRLVHRYKKPE